MKTTPSTSEKTAAVVIWIAAVSFAVGAMIFGH
jgi:hypothetical protein